MSIIVKPNCPSDFLYLQDLSDRLNVTELISVLDGEDGLKHHRTQNMLHTVCTSNAPQQPHSGIHSLESLLQKLLA